MTLYLLVVVIPEFQGAQVDVPDQHLLVRNPDPMNFTGLDSPSLGGKGGMGGIGGRKKSTALIN